jgi:hypothetical protein
MGIDIKKGISLEIEGELGRYKTLPIETLVKISESLQELIMSIIQYDLPSDEPVDLNNFKIELSGFKKNSAIPSFVLTPRVVPTTHYTKQIETLSKKLDRLLDISDRGIYTELKTIYQEPKKRSEIVECLYNFTSSFENSPVLVYETDSNNAKAYNLKKFKPELKRELTVGILGVTKQKKEEETVIGSIKITKNNGKTTRTIQETYSKEQHSLSYSPEIINVRDKRYILHYPLRCLFEKEEDYYVINNEQLDIIGTGLNREDAELNFNEEFDYLYTRLNSLDDNQLNKKMLRIKNTLNNFVKEVP